MIRNRAALIAMLLSVVGSQAQAQMLIDAAPQAFQVVRVPVPASFQGGAVSFLVVAEPNVQLLSDEAGSVDASGASAAVLLTLRVLPGMMPGTPRAARIVFSTPAQRAETEIRVNVASQRAIVLVADDAIPAMSPGQRGHVKFRVTNAGNIADTTKISLRAPGGWRVSPADMAMVLLPGETRAGEFKVFIGSGSGDAYFTLQAASRDTAVQTMIYARVVQSADGSIATGPTMRLAMGAAGRAAGAAHAATNISLDGPLLPGINIHADFARLNATDALQSRALSAVGMRAAQPHLGFSGNRWRVDLGNTWNEFPQVMGTSISGQGGSYKYESNGSAVQALVARPSYRLDGEKAAMLGIGASHTFSSFALSAAAVRFDDPVSQRMLTGIGTGIRTDAWSVADVEADIAYREFGTGRGVGLSTAFRREDERGYAEIRLAHAPGGSRAFSSAQEQASVSLSRQMNDRFAFSAGFSRSQDNPTADGSAVSTNASIAPQLRISPALNVVATVQHASASFRDEQTGFGNETRSATLGFSGGERITWSASAGYEQVGRSIALPTGSFNTAGNRYTWTGTAGYTGTVGTLRLDAHYERNPGATGMMPHMLRSAIAADRVHAPFLPAGVTLNGELALTGWGDRTYLRSRAGATYQIAPGYELTAAVDRDPFYGASGNTPIAFSASVTRTLSLPGFGTLVTGRVFADLNGNGKRDRGEEGVADVTVRAGQQTARTSENGKYRIASSSRDNVRIDATDIPFGWTMGTPESTRAREIPLVPVSALEIGLELGPAELARGVDLSRMVVVARDADGREWLARRASPAIARFDGLPPGSYTVGFDNSAMSEPLRAEGGDVVVNMVNASSEKRTVRLVGRPLRFFSAPVAPAAALDDPRP